MQSTTPEADAPPYASVAEAKAAATPKPCCSCGCANTPYVCGTARRSRRPSRLQAVPVVAHLWRSSLLGLRAQGHPAGLPRRYPRDLGRSLLCLYVLDRERRHPFPASFTLAMCVYAGIPPPSQPLFCWVKNPKVSLDSVKTPKFL